MQERKESFKDEVLKRLLQEFPFVATKASKTGDDTKAFAYLVAWLNTRLESAGLGRVIVTGGFAVELLTGRVYRTMDVDVIAEGEASRVLESLLSRLGERIGRGYLLPSDTVLSLKSIVIVSDIYDRRAPPLKLVIGEFHLYIDPPEHLIITYLAAWKYWESGEDREKAAWLLAATKEIIDWELLKELANTEGVAEELKQLMNELSELLRPR